jgi:hypothetical protein
MKSHPRNTCKEVENLYVEIHGWDIWESTAAPVIAITKTGSKI